ncbi:hypothetical protein C5167_027131 [Papaver somniferum]|nr:hypothetical protein C5167_027131 [Papaver somniferum]
MKSKENPFGRNYSCLVFWNNYKFNPKINPEMYLFGAIIWSEIKNIQEYLPGNSYPYKICFDKSKQCIENRKIKRRLVNDGTTLQEKKRKLPTFYKKEDWENNTSEKFQKKSEQAVRAVTSEGSVYRWQEGGVKWKRKAPLVRYIVQRVSRDT